MNDQKINIYQIEEELYDNGISLVCGVDEAGRGPLAGPVVIAAVIMPALERIDGINDSKKLTAKKRSELIKVIKKKALAISVVMIHEKEIDELNIYQATKKGMLEAIEKLKVKPEYCLIDAMPLSELSMPHTSLIHGDARSASIAAASIVAKVTRDEYMEKMDFKYPNYGFKRHKGYCTKQHKEALEKYGPCPIHRKTYYPVSKYYLQERQLSFNFEEESND